MTVCSDSYLWLQCIRVCSKKTIVIVAQQLFPQNSDKQHLGWFSFTTCKASPV